MSIEEQINRLFDGVAEGPGWEVEVKVDVQAINEPLGHCSPLVKQIKVAIVKAEAAIKFQRLPGDAVWAACLDGLATRCGGHPKLVRELVQLETDEQVVSWYLSAKFTSRDIFSWLEQVGRSDNQSIYAFIMANPWKNFDYVALTDDELITEILLNGWDEPRQMAAMVAGEVVSLRNISSLVGFQGSEWIVEMIARGGIFTDRTLLALQSIYGVDAKNGRQKVERWDKNKIWQFWDRLEISDRDKMSLFVQALGVNKAVEFFRSIPELKDQQIVTELLSLGISLSRLTSAYAPKSNINDPTDLRLLHLQFIEVLERLGKTDQQIVKLLVDAEFTYFMIANSLLYVKWEPERIIDNMLLCGCDLVLLTRMVNLAAETMLTTSCGMFTPVMVAKWNKILLPKTQAIAVNHIFD